MSSLSPVSGLPYPNALPLNASPLPLLMAQLGRQTRIDANGLVRMNQPLIAAIVNHREKAVPALADFLDRHLKAPRPHPLVLAEALMTAQKLAEAETPGVQSLYGIASRLNSWPDPIVQTYLGGFYEKLKNEESFGPALSTLVNMAVTRYPRPNPGRKISIDPPESMGGAVLSLIAHKTAQETVRQLIEAVQSGAFPVERWGGPDFESD
jgi:hypothetical protein